MSRVLIFFLFCFSIACSNKVKLGFEKGDLKKINGKSVNKFSDAISVKIADLQDRRLSDSLYQFFNLENPRYRRDAVLAFASIQDTLAITKLADVLRNDTNAEVRSAAAFALGQIGTQKAFSGLMAALVSEKEKLVLREIIEACGKTSTQENALKLVLPVTDSLQEAFAWSYYRLGLRGVADSLIVKRAVQLLGNNQSTQTRIGSTHFFGRGPKDISLAEETLINTATGDPSALARMAATSALRKINTPSSLEEIKNILDKDTDYRVRTNAVRALQTFPVKDTKPNLVTALSDSNLHVGIAASEVIKAVVTKDEFNELVTLARAATNWRIQGNLFEATLKVSNSKEITEEIFRLYHKVENPYGKAALLTALGQSTLAYNFINEQLHQSQIPVIKSAAAAALVSINEHKEFNSGLQKIFVDVYKKALETGDAAVIGTIASALADSVLGYKKIITDYTFLYTAKSRLSLPKDNEALQPLEAAIAHFEGKKISNEVKNEFNHPIDWNLVKTIAANQKVLIKTGKGDIVIRLLVEEAPGSVANFVQLVNSHYFDAKNFHRVVPNFVIQGGCNRGDGWGSEDYSIRSEFSMRRYTEGSVGMASAGKDTEGTQWFITHSPTPHLDGRYTIFAEVEKGMNVVHRIEVGDTILSVELVQE